MRKIKKLLYFPIAKYFLFFAKIRYKRWKPTVIVVTGSNGKTTLLHLLESQLGNKAKYSHYANGLYGIAFNILGLKRKTLLKSEWIFLFLLAPFRSLSNSPKENIYVVEVDCDRPNEGKIISSFLRPDIVLWISASRTHTVNFDSLIKEKKFSSIEEAVAYEFGFLIESCKKLVILNGDNRFILEQIKRTHVKVIKVTKENNLESYVISNGKTNYCIRGIKYSFSAILPEEVFYGLEMCLGVLKYLEIQPDVSFAKFIMPPGRSSVFRGIKGTTLIDSSYNATPASVEAILAMFKKYDAKKKWIVLSDMVELGEEEREEHEKLAKRIAESDSQRIILMGPRISLYTYDQLVKEKAGVRGKNIKIEKFLEPKEVLEYLSINLQGGETVLFKGARFLEGVIEHLLENKSDKFKLPRRELAWEKRRKTWGL